MLAARIDDEVLIKSFDDVRSLGKQCQVLTVYATAACQFIRKEGGIRVDEDAKSPEILLKKLINRRGRLAFYHDLGLRSIIRKNHLEHQVKILPTKFATYHHYAVFAPHVSAETINLVGAALLTLKPSGALDRIHRRYYLPEE